MEQTELIVNGQTYPILYEKNWNLLYVLREVLGLTGTKCGCGTNDCGACRVIVDGEAKNSCVLMVRNLAGKRIETIEGLSRGTQLHPIQQAFIDAGAVQCSFCTPGMIMSTKALLDRCPDPTEEEIRAALEPNLCRCTGYVKIVEAVQLAAKRLRTVENLSNNLSLCQEDGVIGKPTPVFDARLKVSG
ncbi:MAG: (2Fe-2S)-binding protein, partial [Atopobiaceae bacterium]|nr:(2Fe-2S)-binding protein [Atopobiaceae bacterium]